MELTPCEGVAVTTTNVVLLYQTKQYLAAQLQRQAPNTVLAQAWDEFYRVYSNLIRRFVLAQGLRGTDADDCVQEVWSTVAWNLAGFERPQQRPGLRSWLYTVVRSKSTDYRRRQFRPLVASTLVPCIGLQRCEVSSSCFGCFEMLR